eukprot:m.352517 g.352517  ORF g.352517 m.352517 type:complete len:305 (+) comp16544_c0_seq1:726-1640(+)
MPWTVRRRPAQLPTRRPLLPQLLFLLLLPLLPRLFQSLSHSLSLSLNQPLSLFQSLNQPRHQLAMVSVMLHSTTTKLLMPMKYPLRKATSSLTWRQFPRAGSTALLKALEQMVSSQTTTLSRKALPQLQKPPQRSRLPQLKLKPQLAMVSAMLPSLTTMHKTVKRSPLRRVTSLSMLRSTLRVGLLELLRAVAHLVCCHPTTLWRKVRPQKRPQKLPPKRAPLLQSNGRHSMIMRLQMVTRFPSRRATSLLMLPHNLRAGSPVPFKALANPACCQTTTLRSASFSPLFHTIVNALLGIASMRWF